PFGRAFAPRPWMRLPSSTSDSSRSRTHTYSAAAASPRRRPSSAPWVRAWHGPSSAATHFHPTPSASGATPSTPSPPAAPPLLGWPMRGGVAEVPPSSQHEDHRRRAKQAVARDGTQEIRILRLVDGGIVEPRDEYELGMRRERGKLANVIAESKAYSGRCSVS